MPLNLPADCPPEVREFEENIEREREKTVAHNLRGVDMKELYGLYIAYIQAANVALARSFPAVSFERFEKETLRNADDTFTFTRLIENLRAGFSAVIAIDEASPMPILDSIDDMRTLYARHVTYLADMDDNAVNRTDCPADFPRFLLLLQTPQQLVDKLKELEPEHREHLIKNWQKGYPQMIAEAHEQVGAAIARIQQAEAGDANQ